MSAEWPIDSYSIHVTIWTSFRDAGKFEDYIQK